MSQYVTFVLNDALYGIEVNKVQEVLKGVPTTNVPMSPEEITGLVNLRGQVVTLVDLRKQLNLPSRAEGEEAMMVVVEADGEMISLLVDKIGDVREVKEADFENPPDTLPVEMRELILGAYKLQDNLLLALDVEKAVAVG
ncbi:MAG: chemotaxis protein CheW [Actinomycetaceae bacterium]|nr:chemotaxis protein CheW [Actinomycetaceae bacterium]